MSEIRFSRVCIGPGAHAYVLAMHAHMQARMWMQLHLPTYTGYSGECANTHTRWGTTMEGPELLTTSGLDNVRAARPQEATWKPTMI